MHDEKQRIKAIMTSPHSVGREALARHLALGTDVPAEQAIGVLASAPVAQPGARMTIPQVSQRSADAALLGAISMQTSPGAAGGQAGADHAAMWKRAIARASSPVHAEKRALGLE